MQNTAPKLHEIPHARISGDSGFRVGAIARVTASGRALVDYPGNPNGPVSARSAMTPSPDSREDIPEGCPVLLIFENGDPALPIIVGIIQDALIQPNAPIDPPPMEAVVDGKKTIIRAKEEIVLNCGKSSVTLKKNGRIVVKGTQIVSRASKTNKIKGASVSIN